ncbi:19176_t:CDS:2, partial [Gigaspora margarita]
PVIRGSWLHNDQRLESSILAWNIPLAIQGMSYDLIKDKFQSSHYFIEKHSEDSCIKLTHNKEWNEIEKKRMTNKLKKAKKASGYIR